jgi:hypothetical protein
VYTFWRIQLIYAWGEGENCTASAAGPAAQFDRLDKDMESQALSCAIEWPYAEESNSSDGEESPFHASTHVNGWWTAICAELSEGLHYIHTSM